jgi:hypothetical protein
MADTQDDFTLEELEEQGILWNPSTTFTNPTNRRDDDYKALEEMVDFLLDLHAVYKPTKLVRKYIVHGKAADMVSTGRFEHVQEVVYLALARAVTRGAVEVFPWLTAAGASVDNVIRELTRNDNSETYTMLSLAAFRGQLASVAALLNKGANVNRYPQDGNPALWWAAYAGNVAICKLLLDSGATVDECDGYTEGTPLMAACECGSIAIATMLLEAGADVNYRADKGYCALLHAVRCRHYELVIMLLKAGADLDVSDEYGTVLTLAFSIIAPPEPLLELLLNAGAPVSLFGVAESDYRGDVAVIKRLLQAGAPRLGIDAVGIGWAIVTYVAIREERTSVLCLMLAAGESIYQQRPTYLGY